MWRSGDIALIVADPKDASPSCRHLIGSECQLISYYGDISNMKNVWKIRVGNEMYAAAEHCLKKPYDGNQPGTWEGIEQFKPRILERVE